MKVNLSFPWLYKSSQLNEIMNTNKEIITLSNAYKEIFRSENLHDNLNNLNGEFKDNSYVKEVVDFINKDKKRPICTPFSK